MDEQQNPMVSPITLFYSYAHEDEPFREQLEKHLRLLGRQGLLSTWSDRQIVAGTEWAQEIDAHLETASIILLLISPDFLASDYCYDIEMRRALDRHERGEAQVIPILLRPVDWKNAPFSHLQGLPRDFKPVSAWPDRDEAFLDIEKGIRWTIEHLRAHLLLPPPDLQPGRPTMPLKPGDRQDRRRFLDGLQDRYDSVLKQSLQGAAFLQPDLRARPDAVISSARLVFRHVQQPTRVLPGTSLLQLYDEQRQELLLLGDPGAGKSTLLLHLAQDLLARAQRNEQHLLPVIFNLSSWAERRPKLVDWLVEELVSNYQLKREQGQRWVHSGQILPLLDGLDEVAATARGACIDAINAYRRDYLVPIVVCSRTNEILAEQRRLLLQAAFVIQPLSDEQIYNYLAADPKLAEVRTIVQKNEQLRELVASPLMLNILVIACQGSTLQKLLTAGSREDYQRILFDGYLQRMLSTAVMPPQKPMNWLKWLLRPGSCAKAKATPAQSPLEWLKWLIWVAKQGRKVFYIERMQPDCLAQDRSRQRYSHYVMGLIFGLIGVLFFGTIGGPIFTRLLAKSGVWQFPGFFLVCVPLFGLVAGLVGGSLLALLNGSLYHPGSARGPGQPKQRRWKRAGLRVIRGMLSGLVIGLLLGVPLGLFLADKPTEEISFMIAMGAISWLVGGLMFALIEGLLGVQTEEVRPVEVFDWSWLGMLRNLVIFLFLGILGSLLVGFLIKFILAFYDSIATHSPVDFPLIASKGLGLARSLMPFFALLAGLIGGLTGGLSGTRLAEIKLIVPNQGTWRSAQRALIVGLSVGLIGSLVVGFIIRLGSTEWGFIRLYVLIIGPLVGLISGLRAGGIACIQHLVLRYLLCHDGEIPWRFVRFLEGAAYNILLLKNGGGYTFTHQLFREYLVSLQWCTCGYHDDHDGVLYCPRCGKLSIPTNSIIAINQ